MVYKAYVLDDICQRILVFAGEAAVHLCLVTTGTDRVAELVLRESFGQEFVGYLHTTV